MKILQLVLLSLLASAGAIAGPESTPRGVIWFVEYVVGKDGMPTQIKIVVTADPSRDDEVIAAVAKNWKSPPEWAGRKLREHFHFVTTTGTGVLVTVEFTTDSDGRPKDIQVVRAPDRSKDKAIVAVVSKWRFPADYAGHRRKQQFYFVE
jgi:TonB family protein